VFWVLHGEEEFLRSEFLAKLKSELGDPSMADLNTMVLDGRRVTQSEIIYAADSIPFLTGKRLVLVEGLLSRLSADKKPGKSKKGPENAASGATQASSFLDELIAYLGRVPETTILVLVESQPLPSNHPLRSLSNELSAKGKVQEFRPLFAEKDGAARLNKWIRERAASKGLEIFAEVVQALAKSIGYDLRLMDQELEKLSAYAAGNKKLTAADVRQLVPYVREADIFEMVDAFGRRDVQQATRLLHQMLDEGNAPLYLLSMIVRQFRIMIQVKELRSLGFDLTGMARELKLHEFAVKKGLAQAQNFSSDQLLDMYYTLAELDAAIKTGKVQDVLALDLFIAELCAV
jgi:DNA polymerase III subunit delta